MARTRRRSLDTLLRSRDTIAGCHQILAPLVTLHPDAPLLRVAVDNLTAVGADLDRAIDLKAGPAVPLLQPTHEVFTHAAPEA